MHADPPQAYEALALALAGGGLDCGCLDVDGGGKDADGAGKDSCQLSAVSWNASPAAKWDADCQGSGGVGVEGSSGSDRAVNEVQRRVLDAARGLGVGRECALDLLACAAAAFGVRIVLFKIAGEGLEQRVYYPPTESCSDCADPAVRDADGGDGGEEVEEDEEGTHGHEDGAAEGGGAVRVQGVDAADGSEFGQLAGDGTAHVQATVYLCSVGGRVSAMRREGGDDDGGDGGQDGDRRWQAESGGEWARGEQVARLVSQVETCILDRVCDVAVLAPALVNALRPRPNEAQSHDLAPGAGGG